MTAHPDPSANSTDLLCPRRGKQIEEAWASHRAGDARAFLELAGSIYDWLDWRVASILRGYPGLDLPADELLSDEILDRVSSALARHEAASCEDFVRLVSSEVRWAIRTVIRERRRLRDRTVSLEAAGPEDGDADWLDDRDTANPLEEMLAQEEGEQFALARARFDEAAASLTEPLRKTFCLRYYAGLPLAEVSAELGVTDRAVRQRVKDALDAISERLTGKAFPGKPPQFKGAAEGEGRSRCRPAGEADGSESPGG
jgi:RNA polymerase sigma factor (sigma-70 family)